jgi:hypothetical protein
VSTRLLFAAWLADIMLHNRREYSWLQAESHVQSTLLTPSALTFTLNLFPVVYADGNALALLFLVQIAQSEEWIMEARGRIAPVFLYQQRYVEVSDKLHILNALLWGKEHPVPSGQATGWRQSRSGRSNEGISYYVD